MTYKKKKTRGMEGSKTKNKIREAFLHEKEVEIIPATESIDHISRIIRVAAYCRVSTFDEAQSGSLELQKLAYREKIERNKDWELVGIYADEGISGTSLKNRVAFKQLIDGCRDHKIDLIIVKSISRFSRNLLDFISINRELKALEPPVGILIEDVNINTLDNRSELFLGFLSLIAQGESEQKSASITWSIIERFKKGLPIIPTHNLLGYGNDRYGKIAILENEAEIVRLIYNSFIEGFSPIEISTLLNSRAIPTVTGTALWKSSTIYRILRNEKYSGDVLMQKTYTLDCFSHTRKKNTGQRPKYLLRNGIPAIIDKIVWDDVQKMLKDPKRRKKANLNCIEKKVLYITKVKSGMLKGFSLIDPQWTKDNIIEIIEKFKEDERRNNNGKN